MRKLLIAGSRDYGSVELVDEAISLWARLVGYPDWPSEIVNGKAPTGIDKHAYNWADKNDVLLKIFPANWARFKKAAGHYRNAEMAEYCDSAIIIWDMVSPGSLNMIDNMRRVSKPYLVYTIENNKLKEIKNVGF